MLIFRSKFDEPSITNFPTMTRLEPPQHLTQSDVMNNITTKYISLSFAAPKASTCVHHYLMDLSCYGNKIQQDKSFIIVLRYKKYHLECLIPVTSYRDAEIFDLCSDTPILE